MNLKINLLGNPLSDALLFCGRQSFASTVFFYVEFTPLSSLIQMVLPECGLPEALECSSPRPTPQVYKKRKAVGSFSLVLLSLRSWSCLVGAWTSLSHHQQLGLLSLVKERKSLTIFTSLATFTEKSYNKTTWGLSLREDNGAFLIELWNDTNQLLSTVCNVSTFHTWLLGFGNFCQLTNATEFCMSRGRWTLGNSYDLRELTFLVFLWIDI